MAEAQVKKHNPKFDEMKAKVDFLTLESAIDFLFNIRPDNSDRKSFLRVFSALKTSLLLGLITRTELISWFASEGESEHKFEKEYKYIKAVESQQQALILGVAKGFGFNISDALTENWKRIKTDRNFSLPKPLLIKEPKTSLKAMSPNKVKVGPDDVAKVLDKEFPQSRLLSHGDIGGYLKDKTEKMDHQILGGFIVEQAKKELLDIFVMPSGSLKIPLFNSDGEIANIETIYSNGNKIPIEGALFKSTFCLVGSTLNTVCGDVIVCEGFYTGVVINFLTGLPVIVCRVNNNLSFGLDSALQATKSVQGTQTITNVLYVADNDFATLDFMKNYNSLLHNSHQKLSELCEKHDVGFDFFLPRYKEPLNFSNNIKKRTDVADLPLSLGGQIFNHFFKQTKDSFLEQNKDVFDSIMGRLYRFITEDSDKRRHPFLSLESLDKPKGLPTIFLNNELFASQDFITRYFSALLCVLNNFERNSWVAKSDLKQAQKKNVKGYRKGFIDLPGDLSCDKEVYYDKNNLVFIPVLIGSSYQLMGFYNIKCVYDEFFDDMSAEALSSDRDNSYLKRFQCKNLALELMQDFTEAFELGRPFDVSGISFNEVLDATKEANSLPLSGFLEAIK